MSLNCGPTCVKTWAERTKKQTPQSAPGILLVPPAAPYEPFKNSYQHKLDPFGYCRTERTLALDPDALNLRKPGKESAVGLLFGSSPLLGGN